MTATYTTYKTDGTIDTVEFIPTTVSEGDRVVFVDNSYMDDCPNNLTPNRSRSYPAGFYGRTFMQQLSGVVLHTDSPIQAIDTEWLSIRGLVKRVIDLPIVVLGDDDSIIYCNQHNISRI